MEENSMIFIKIENGIIVSRISATTKPEGYELDPRGISQIGARRDLWDENFNEKPLSRLVKENIIEIPQGYKLEGDQFIEMTNAEKIKAKILKPTDREKIDEDKIVPKTMDELYTDKLITAKEYNEYIVNARRNAFAIETDPMYYDVQEGTETKENWLKAKQAIRDKYKKVKE
jgi:hypothetical protein